MDQTEFERRKRHLEAELEAGVELLRAGFRAQLRALAQLWIASPADGAPLPGVQASPAPQPVAPIPGLQAPNTASAPSQKRRPAGELYNQVLSLLETVPEVFDRRDLLPLLGAPPKRTSLHNVLEELRREGVLATEERGRGAVPTRYRRRNEVEAWNPEP